MLAQRLNISRNHLFEIAIERFIKTSQEQPDPKELSGVSYPDAKAAAPIDVGRLVINQGDIYWVQLDDPNGLEPGIPHPHVVIQENIFNHSRIHTVVVCALTSNIKRASIPGNVLLEGGEANLSRPSVVEASKVSSIDKMQLGEYIGSLSEGRINQIVAGMRFLHRSFFAR
ncbi:MAG: type II toxin-antitoxin system PemK/MazF family toxin [Chloroflexi bacterium]|nr:type II toxin-antitoxin system PemK/MazF family toxin [Chloroflexota bacterium]